MMAKIFGENVENFEYVSLHYFIISNIFGSNLTNMSLYEPKH